jgi:hypothetical protein
MLVKTELELLMISKPTGTLPKKKGKNKDETLI